MAGWMVGRLAHEIGVRCSNWDGDTAQNSKTEGDTAQRGGDTAHNNHILLRMKGGHHTIKCVQIFTLGWGHRT